MHAVFDLDGTLVDSVGVCTAIVNTMLADRGSSRRLADTAVAEWVSVGGATMMSGLLGDLCADPEEEIRTFRALYADLPTPPSSLYEGAVVALDRLKAQGVTLTICSNKPQALCDKVLGELGLASHFDAVVGSAPELARKPDPAILLHTLRKVGGSLDRCCFIGDAAPDYLVARRADVPFVLMTHGYAEADISFDGAIRCHRFRDLPGMVLKALRAPMMAGLTH